MGNNKNDLQRGKRQLKVYSKYFERAYRESVVFPEIRLSGKWLKEMGFECGQIVTVIQERNRIILSVENNIEMTNTMEAEQKLRT